MKPYLLILPLLFLLSLSASSQLTVGIESGGAISVFSEIVDHDRNEIDVTNGFRSYNRRNASTGIPVKFNIYYEIKPELIVGIRTMYFNSLTSNSSLLDPNSTIQRTISSENFSTGPIILFHRYNLSEKITIRPVLWIPIQLYSKIIRTSINEGENSGNRIEHIGRTRLGFESGLLLEYMLDTKFSFTFSSSIHAASLNAKKFLRYDMVNGDFDKNNPTIEFHYQDIGAKVPLNDPGVSSAGETFNISHFNISIGFSFKI